MASNPHFVTVASWEEAAGLVGFEPRVPEYTAGCALDSLAVWVKDHELREVTLERRSLEAHYGRFVLEQSRPGEDEATRLALEVSYGSGAAPVTVAGHEGRSYPLGSATEPDDVDGRAPAVVVWAEGARFYLVASDQLEAEVLLQVAESLGEVGWGGRDGLVG